MKKLPPIKNPAAGELAVRALRPLFIHFNKTCGKENLIHAISLANLGSTIDLNYLSDENNWVSFEAGQRLIDILSEYSGDPNFERESGLALASKESLGFAFSIFKSFGSPKACYEHIFNTLHLYNRVGDFKILKITNTYLRFSYTSYVAEPNIKFSEFRLYQFASIPILWDLPPAKAKKLRCQVTEDTPESIYELTWRGLPENKIRFSTSLIGAGLASTSLIMSGWGTAISFILGGALFGLLAGQTVTSRQRLKNQESILREQTEDLLQSMTEIQIRYDEVQALNVSLEQKVRERTTELTAANERLQELDKLKDRFLANISHELRTPLVALSSTLQMILNKELHDPELHDQLLRNSAEALEDMLENVNDLLLKTRSEKGMIDIRWSEIDIGEFVARTLKVFNSLAHKENNKLRFINELTEEEPLAIYADRAKLKKIINNLVGNALKYTNKGDVTVRLCKNKDHCMISVSDTGRGIPADELESVFEPFFQASNNPYREAQGTGIGLSLVKDLVQLHHGYIEVSSKINKGSQFQVSLPLGKDHVDLNNLDTSPYTDESDQRINLGIKSFDDLDLSPFSTKRPYIPNLLLVEDNPQIIQVLAYVLKDYYNLYFARNGREGLEKAYQLKPNLVISDIMMPGMNGYELVQAIRDEPELKGIPVILLTSKADRMSRIQGFEHGADEYLTKPFNNQEVLIRIKGLIEKKLMETEFIHMEKMVALGQLAAGIGHEINNPIAYAKSATDTIDKVFNSVAAGKISLDDGMKMMRGAINRIKEGTTRVAEITEAMRGFIRQGAKGFQPYDIHTGIESTLKILHTNHKAKIRFRRDYKLTEKVECNINQLNQVVMNLTQNAAHAMEDQTDAEIDICTYQQEDMACVIIQDNGPGIPNEQLGRIFDPFFTTKALGMGTGLGLHICKQIIEEHNGTLTLHNNPGGGVQCKILLPLRSRGAAEHARFTHSHIDRNVEKVHYPHRG